MKRIPQLLKSEKYDIFTELEERKVPFSVVSYRANIDSDQTTSTWIYSIIARKCDRKELLGLAFSPIKKKDSKTHELIEHELCLQEIGDFRQHSGMFKIISNAPFGKVWEVKGNSLSDSLEVQKPCSKENLLGY